MIIFDIILFVILSGFIFYGLFFGLIRTVGSLLGIVGGLWLTLIFYLDVFDWAKNLFFGHELAGKIITFFILFALINRIIGFIFVILDRTFDLISIIPFLKTINRLAGAALGFIEGGLVLGLALAFLSQTVFGHWLDASKVAPFLIGYTQAIMPLLPGLLNRVKGMV